MIQAVPNQPSRQTKVSQISRGRGAYQVGVGTPVNLWASLNSMQRSPGCACGGSCPTCKDEEENIQIQTKLKVGAPDDKYEQEADRVAEMVVRMPNPQEGRAGRAGILRAKPKPAATLQAPPHVVNQINGLGGTGRPLPQPTRDFFASRIGSDLGRVRIHIGAMAQDVAESLNARAFTFGSNIVFGANEYAPDKHEGQRLLAHELTHTLQQDGSKPNLIQRQPRSPDEPPQPADIPEPPNSITIDILDPLNSHLRIGD